MGITYYHELFNISNLIHEININGEWFPTRLCSWKILPCACTRMICFYWSSCSLMYLSTLLMIRWWTLKYLVYCVTIWNLMQIPSRRQTDKVQCYEPATMKYLGYFPALKPDEVRFCLSLLDCVTWIHSRIQTLSIRILFVPAKVLNWYWGHKTSFILPTPDNQFWMKLIAEV